MTIEQALREALKYEVNIRDLYVDAARKAEDEEAGRFYRLLGEDEQSHVDYLQKKLQQWKVEGRISFETLASALPDPGRVEDAARKAGAPLSGRELGGETEALSRALKAEELTSAFYRNLVGGLEGEAGRLFARFVEIEEGHTRIVRAELDLTTKTGHWFDMRVFDLED